MIRSQILVSIFMVAAVVPSVSTAQKAPYAGLETRQIKALSPEQIAEYKQGHGMGLALAAELNGFPGPKHVLELSSELSLTSEQRRGVQEVFDAMHSAAVDLGEQIVERERELDELFVGGDIDEQSLQGYLTELASLQGELRNTHLAAHLETKSLLTVDQVDSYNQMRGYESQGHQHHPGNHRP